MKKLTCLTLVLLLTGFLAQQPPRLSELRIFNRVVLLVKEQYVEPNRIDPKAMLLSALGAVEQKIPSVLVSDPVNNNITVQVGKKSKDFDISEDKSLWDTSFLFRNVSTFIEENLPKSVDVNDIQYAAANGMLKTLDPHSMILEPKYSTEMKVATKGEFGGLGVVIGLRDGFLTVISPLEGTPAYKAGIKALDRIVKIDENSTVNLGLDEAVEKMRGKPGSRVVLTILRKGDSVERRISIVRSIIKVDSVSSKLIDGRYAYVKVKAFHGNTTHDVKAAMEAMKLKSKGKLAGLILDFRNNPGGLLDQSVSMSDLFLDGGTVVITQGSVAKNRDEERASFGPEKTKLPLVVLVNNGSASASEIVAGAIKNRERGIVVGEQTFGKGSVQMLYDFPDKSSLKLTIAQYLTPGEESIQSIGITPDILLRPIYADEKTQVSLFPETRMREEDLAAHLDDSQRIKQHKSEFELPYLSKQTGPDESETLALSSKYQSDFEITFAQKVLEKTQSSSRSDMLAAAAQVVTLIKQEEDKKLEQALTKFGINWSRPKEVQTVKPSVTAKIIGSTTVKAGETLSVSLAVTNTSKTPIWQVYGISDSATGLLEGKEFLYGKLEPGKKGLWKVDIKIPKDVLTRRDLMRVVIKGNGDQVLSSIDVPIDIMGLLRPILAYSYYLDDTQYGNGDGFLEVGERADLVLLIKNVGKGTADEPWALLKNMSGEDVFIDDGRQKLSELKSGGMTQTRLSFTLRNETAQAKLQLQLYDTVTSDFWGEQFELPVKSNIEIKKVSGTLVTTQKDVELRATAEAGGVVFAKLPKGLKLTQLVQVGNYTRVRTKETWLGFVETALLEEPSKILTTSNPVLIYHRMPPVIELAGGLDKPIVADDTYQLSIKITDDKPMLDAYMFVNDQKVFYQVLPEDKNTWSLDTKIKLKPGLNWISLVTREDENYSQAKNLTIFSQSGDPIAKEKVSMH